mgnify:CR=1 FL=1
MFLLVDVTRAINEIKKVKEIKASKTKPKNKKSNSNKKELTEQKISEIERKLKLLKSKESSSQDLTNIKEKQVDEVDLEEEIEEDENNEEEFVNVDYSHEEELIINEIYGSLPLNYTELFYGGTTSNVSGNPYAMGMSESSHLLSDSENMLLSESEAEKMMIKVQNAATTKNFEGVNYKERDKLAQWVKFNPVLMRVFESVHGMTRNVEYDRLY